MRLPTEPIRSIPRPLELIDAGSRAARTKAFAKIEARVRGTALASDLLGARG